MLPLDQLHKYSKQLRVCFFSDVDGAVIKSLDKLCSVSMWQNAHKLAYFLFFWGDSLTLNHFFLSSCASLATVDHESVGKTLFVAKKLSGIPQA